MRKNDPIGKLRNVEKKFGFAEAWNNIPNKSLASCASNANTSHVADASY